MMMAPGLLVAGLNRLRAGLVPVRAAAWLFAALAIWGPLLNLPLVRHGEPVAGGRLGAT